MSTTILIAALVFMSMAFAVEATWLNRKLASTAFFKWLNQNNISKVLQLIYFIGLPYLALLSGLIPARLFGLKNWDSISLLVTDAFSSHTAGNWQMQLGGILQLWLADAGVLISIISSLMGVGIIFGWLYLRGNQAQKTAFPSNFQLTADIIHWSFYRAAIWRITGDLYLSVLGGIFLILIEYLLVYKMAGKQTESGQQMAIRVGGNTIVAIGFLFAPNLWVAGFLYLMILQFTKIFTGLYQAQN